MGHRNRENRNFPLSVSRMSALDNKCSSTSPLRSFESENDSKLKASRWDGKFSLKSLVLTWKVHVNFFFCSVRSLGLPKWKSFYSQEATVPHSSLRPTCVGWYEGTPRLTHNPLEALCQDLLTHNLLGQKSSQDLLMCLDSCSKLERMRGGP